MEQQKQQKKQQALEQARKQGGKDGVARGVPDGNAPGALQGIFAVSIGIAKCFLKEPLLLVAIWASSLGAATLAIQVCWAYPWLPLFGAGITCLLARFAQAVEFQGLLPLFLRSIAGALERPLYELLSEAFRKGAVVACNVLRLGMLACMDLREEQRRELLSGMDPAFRDFVFRQPTGLLLPWLVRRALLGRNVDSLQPGSGPDAAAATDPALLAHRQSTNLQSRRNSCSANGAVGSATSCSSEGDAGSEAGDVERTLTGRSAKASDSLFDYVRGVEEVAQNGRASAEFASMERILAQKMVTGTTAFAARNLASTAQAQVGEALEFGRAKASEAVVGVREAAADPRTRSTAVGGAVALGAGGGATGMVSGGAIGAAIGVVPAVFTFGLSIPVGAAIGSGVGLAAGAVGAGVTGFLGGGALGWGVYRRTKGQQVGAVEGEISEDDVHQTVRLER